MNEAAGESGWISAAEFHRAEGVSDWRVTAAGPQAIFTVRSLPHATELLPPIVVAAERFGVLPDIDVRAEGVVVRASPDNHGVDIAAWPDTDGE
jgi:4a-hydroxytetrahydrobiopterin dehydratase